MNTKLLSVLLVCAVLVGGILGFALRGSLSNNQVDGLFGAITVPSVSTTTHGTALQSSLLFQWEQNVAQTLADLRAVNGGFSTTTPSIGFPTLGNIGAATSTASTTISLIINGNGALNAGDFVLPPTPANGTSSPGAFFNYTIINSSTLGFFATNGASSTGGTLLIPTSTYGVRVIRGTIPALRVGTTTTPYNN